MRYWYVILATLGLLISCGPEEAFDEATEGASAELAIGAIDDLKADGDWGAATICKVIPEFDSLDSPEIVISLDGLTLHLIDKTTGYDKVFPIGPGAIEDGNSLTPLSLGLPEQVFHIRLDKPVGQESANPSNSPWAYAYSCRIWWLNGDTGQKIPVFAGLPFLRLEGAPTLGYAIHGPVDSYTLPNGGKLTRGFVSHGCVRMEAADISEVFARCLGHNVPVRVQQSVERRADGMAVDVPDPWLLSECGIDEDCSFDGGICRANLYGGRGVCTKSCMKFCPDRHGYPTSFCVADPADEEVGICTLKGSALNNFCQRYPGHSLAAATPRFNGAGTTADVCLPGSDGWVGAPCFTDLDCAIDGRICQGADALQERPGFCTETCTKYCPDATGQPETFCIGGAASGGECVQKCTIPDDCPFGYQCEVDVPRFNQPEVSSDVCL